MFLRLDDCFQRHFNGLGSALRSQDFLGYQKASRQAERDRIHVLLQPRSDQKRS